MRIISHKLADTPFKSAQSAGGKLVNPTAIVCHDTADFRPGQACEWFTSPECNTSAHVVVERDGSLTQLVKFDTVAYHAGKSSWNGRSGCNAFTLGIEIVNPGMMERRGNEVLLIYREKNRQGKTVEKIIARFPVSECREVNTKEHGKGWCLPYTDAQIKTVTDLCKTLVGCYPSITEVVTHWLIAPKRKVDTNPLFSLDAVRKAAFAVRGEDAVANLTPMQPAPVKPVGVVKAAYDSKSVWTAVTGLLAWLANLFQDTIQWAFDWVLWFIGLLPGLASEVKITLTSGELMSQYFRLNWGKISVTVAIVCTVVYIIRHIGDKKTIANTPQ